MKILLINQPLNNRGDEAAHRAFVGALLKAYPAAKVEVLFAGTPEADIDAFKVDDKRVEYKNLVPARLFFKFRCSFLISIKSPALLKFVWKFHPTIRAIMRECRKSDVVVCAPGGTCLGWQRNWMHLFFLQMAEFSGKPTAYWGRSIGPFPTGNIYLDRFYEISRRLLGGFGFISLRDSQSLELASSLGLEAVPTTDSAFLNRPDARIPADIRKMTGKDYSVFVPNVLTCMKGFEGRITEEDSLRFFGNVLKHILSHSESPVVMLPQTFNQGEWNDVLFFRKLAADANTDRVVVLPDNLSSDIQQSIIAGAKFVVGARYHSIVFAINNEVPFTALSYEHKISGLLNLIDMKDRGVNILDAFDSKEKEEKALNGFRHAFDTMSATLGRDKAVKLANDAFGRLCKFIKDKPRVSVIVPNYNHARFLDERIHSVLEQTYQDFELILLDDCSTDESRKVLEKYRKHPKVSTIVFNEQNSGSSFKQWEKGFQLAEGELIWIAESDDSALPDFLATMVAEFDANPHCVLAFCQANMCGADGTPLSVHPFHKMLKPGFRMHGKRFISKYLCTGNYIVNASNTVFKASALNGVQNSFASCYQTFKGVGDWLFWLGVARTGDVAFVPRPLSLFRQHGSNTTSTLYTSGIGSLEQARLLQLMEKNHLISCGKALQMRVDNLYDLQLRDNMDQKAKEACRTAWHADSLLVRIRMHFRK